MVLKLGEQEKLRVFFTPEVVLDLIHGDEDQMTFTPQDVRDRLEALFERVNIKGLKFFYSQDRNVFCIQRFESPEVKAKYRGKAEDMKGILDQVRPIITQWLYEKGADSVMVSVQTLPPLVSENGYRGKNTTGWAPIVGRPDLVCKLATVPCFQTDVPEPIMHPNLMDERRIPLERQQPFTQRRSLCQRTPGVHLTLATHIPNVRNILESMRDFSPKMQLKLMLDGLRGLAHLHELGLIYCDFKPDQVLAVQEDGKWMGKLADIEALREAGSSGIVIQTPSYSEDYRYRRGVKYPVDESRDVFSVSVALMHFLLLPHDEAFETANDLDNLLKLNSLGEKMVKNVLYSYTYSSSEKEEQLESAAQYLSKWMSLDLARMLIKGLGDDRKARPTLEEIIHLLEEELTYCQITLIHRQ